MPNAGVKKVLAVASADTKKEDKRPKKKKVRDLLSKLKMPEASPASTKEPEESSS
jgi:hypothetical protein